MSSLIMLFQTCMFFISVRKKKKKKIAAMTAKFQKHNKTTIKVAWLVHYYERSEAINIFMWRPDWNLGGFSLLLSFFSPFFVIGLSFPFAPLIVTVTVSVVVVGTATAHHQIRSMDGSSMTTGRRKVNTCWSLQHNCEAFLWGQHSVWVKVTK